MPHNLTGANWKVKTQYNGIIDGYDLVVFIEQHDGARDFYTLKHTPAPDKRYPTDDAVMWIDKQLLQSFLDTAWGLGLRPTGYNDLHEAMKTQDAHLQDMRAIAFGKLKIVKP